MEQMSFPTSVYAAPLVGLPEPRLRPFYTVPEIVKYADTSARTARGWLSGYDEARTAVVTPGSERDLRSFADLVEVAAIAAARRAQMSLQGLRIAIATARKIYGWERPLLERQFQHDGREFFVPDDETGGYVSLNRHGQVAWHLLSAVLKALDYEQDLAIRWWPIGRHVPISVDPRISFGRPFIEGAGVSTVAVSERFKAGERMEELAEDYDIDVEVIERAIRFEQAPRTVD